MRVQQLQASVSSYWPARNTVTLGTSSERTAERTSKTNKQSIFITLLHTVTNYRQYSDERSMYNVNCLSWHQPTFWGAMLRKAQYCYGMSSIRISVRPSVRPSVTLVDCDYIHWDSRKVINGIPSLLGDLTQHCPKIWTWRDLCQIWGRINAW